MKISWPTPARASPIAPANAATSDAPTTPASTPAAIANRLPARPLRHRQHDADDEPRLDDFTKNNNERAKHRRSLSVVSLTGRRLFDDQETFGRVLMVVVEETIAASRQRTDLDCRSSRRRAQPFPRAASCSQIPKALESRLDTSMTIGLPAGAVGSAGENLWSLSVTLTLAASSATASGAPNPITIAKPEADR